MWLVAPDGNLINLDFACYVAVHGASLWVYDKPEPVAPPWMTLDFFDSPEAARAALEKIRHAMRRGEHMVSLLADAK
ncbi:MAG: hypothetical protein ACYC35_11580 [Pirellulales bacterium]|jgi:hypothetical protein